MAKFHATMMDETGCEFGVTLDVDNSVENVTEYFREMYPECSVLFVESAHDLPKDHYHDIWQARWDNDTQDLY